MGAIEEGFSAEAVVFDVLDHLAAAGDARAAQQEILPFALPPR
jgi:hypothetical protein